MNYGKFCKALKQIVLADQELAIKEENYIFWQKGYKPKESHEKEIIRIANTQHFKKDIDTELLDDFLFIAVEVHGENQKCICHFPMISLYTEFRKNGWEAVLEIIKRYVTMVTVEDEFEIPEDIEDYGAMKERIIVDVVNYNDEIMDLKNCVYKLIGDVAYTICFKVFESEDRTVYGKITEDLVKAWKIDFETIWNDALANTYAKFQPRLYKSLANMEKASMTEGAFMALGYNLEQYKKEDRLVLTTTLKRNGAVAICYPNVKERISQIMGGDYFFVMVGGNNVLFELPGKFNIDRTKETLYMTESQYPGSILSQEIYYYDSKTNEIKVVDTE